MLSFWLSDYWLTGRSSGSEFLFFSVRFAVGETVAILFTVVVFFINDITTSFSRRFAPGNYRVFNRNTFKRPLFCPATTKVFPLMFFNATRAFPLPGM